MLKATELDSCIWLASFPVSPHKQNVFLIGGTRRPAFEHLSGLGAGHEPVCGAWVRGCVDRCVSVWIDV